MATDFDFGSDWGEDPFSGEVSFDSDFDSASNQGFLHSVATGFLKGLVDKTIGDTDARIDTLKMVLPNTYLGAFSTLADLNRKRRELMQEIKSDSFETVKDLQYLAGRASAKLHQLGSNRIGAGLDAFSKNDFSDWENTSGQGYDDTVRMDETSDEDVSAAIKDADANSLLGRETLLGVADNITGMMTTIGGRTLAQLGSLSGVNVRTNQLLEQVVDYQRRVQARNDAMKLNVLTRTYLTNVKFYKFVEASNHRIVTELKGINLNSAKSDYEKTSHSQAVRKSVRESIFNTAKSKIGGIANFFDQKFGKDARGDFNSGVSDLVGSIRMAVEMSEGQNLNYGQILGSAAAQMFINNLPRMFKSDRAQKYLDKFKTEFPEQAKWADDAYKRIGDLGNVATYNLTNAEGLANTMAKHYQGGGDMYAAEDYEEYLDTLPEGKEPLKKFEWTILHNARKLGNKSIEGVLDNVSKSGGTKYDLERRTLNDSFNVAQWTKRSDVTLNEVIPRLLTELHLSVEKFRTGNDDLKPITYDYVKGTIISHDQKVSGALNKVMDKRQFKAQAEMANRMVEELDTDGALTPEAKRALAMRFARDTDADLGFSPYNYLNTESDGLPEAIAAEIRTVMQGQFGLTEEQIKLFKEGSDVDRLKLLTYLPTEEARAKAANLAQSSKTLGAFTPDIVNNLDVLKANGYYDTFKKAGIVKTEHGQDSVNMDLFWDVLGKYIKDPERDTAPPVPDAPDLPSRPFGGPPTPPLPPTPPGPNPPLPKFEWPEFPKFKWPDLPKFPAWAALPKFPAWPALPKWPAYPEFKWPKFPDMPKPKADRSPKPDPKPGPAPAPASVNLNGMDELLDSLGGLGGLRESVDALSKNLATPRSPESFKIDWMPVTAGFESVTERIDTLISLGTARNATLESILLRQPPKSAIISETDEKIVTEEKKGILDRLKSTNFKDIFNGSIDKLLDHNPLILGGLLGGLAGLAIHNPKAAGLLAGGAVVATVYGKMKSMSSARTASDAEDLYEEGSDTPILEAEKLRNQDYYDATKGFVIKTWDMIVGSVRDGVTGAIIGARKLSGKLFTADNKEVFLRGLSAVRNAAIKAFKLLDPFNRLSKLKDTLVTRIYQMDVYKEGDDSPTLVGKRFAKGDYCKRNEAGELVVINGWNEIDGPVYTPEGEVIITQEEYDRGLKTSMGVSVNKLQDATKKLGIFGLGLFNKIKDKIHPAAKDAMDKAKNAFRMEYAPIVTSIDRIYNLLLRHWGYEPDDLTTEDLPPPPVDDVDKTDADEGPGKRDVVPPTADDLIDPPKPGKKKNPKPAPTPEPSIDDVTIPSNPSIKPKTKLEEAEDKVKDAALDKRDGRLNSIRDKKEQKKEEKRNMVWDSIISLAGRFGAAGNGKEGDEKKESTGLFGLLAGGFSGIIKAVGGITAWFAKTMLGGFTTLFKFAGMGLRVLPVLATGVAAMAKGIVTLIKTRSLSEAGGSIMDTIRGRRGPPRPPRPPRTAGSHIGSGVKFLGAGMAIDMAGGMLKDAGIVDEGSVVDKVIDTAGTVSDVAGAYQLAAGAAAMAGFSLTGGLMTGAGVVGGWLATAGAAALTVLASPVVLTGLAVGAVAYGTYRYATRGEGKQFAIRMTQYGVSDIDSDLAKKLLQAEDLMKDHIVIGNGRASFSKQAPIQQVMELFVTDPKNKKEIGDIFTWFNGRVKPVMLTYAACLDTVKMKSLKEYDESKSQDVYKVAKQASQALAAVMPFPYSIVAKVDTDTPILEEKATVIRVNNLLEELKAYIDRQTDSRDLQSVDVPTLKNKEGLAKEKIELENQIKTKEGFGRGKDAYANEVKARARLKVVDSELTRLNTSYKAGETVDQVYINDLLPEGRPLDLLTAVRVAVYGNDENRTWRIQAVLKLERYCEQLFQVTGEDVKFTGQIGDLFNLFKGSFQVDKEDADDWCLWFRDRFLPTLTTYMKAVNHYRRGKPGVVWKTLSATARFEIAQQLVATQTKGMIFDTSVWNVRAAPFKDATSPAQGEKVTRFLNLMGEVSTTAKLRDPEGEAGKTNASTWAKTVAPHKMGGGYQPEAANIDTVDKAKTRRDVGLGGQFGTAGGGSGNTYGAGGVMGTPANKYGFIPMKGETDTSHLDMSGVKAQEGNDKGVSVPKKLAQQILIREMMKQGFTDPRQVASMLALTEYESQGYSRTTENMKYSSPGQLVKMFREVRDANQAKQLIDAGEVAIANTVYGGGKGQSIGNTEPGDGWKYRGRGFIQLTGKANYAKTGKALGLDLVNKPELASTDPNVMAQIAVDFFKNSKLLQSIGQTGDFGTSAKGLNGGNDLPGMPARYQLYLQYLDKIQKGELGAEGDTATPEATGQTASGLYGTPSPAAANDPAGATSAPTGETPASSGGGGGGGSAPQPDSSAPMMGTPNMPSLRNSPSGGSVSGPDYSSPLGGGGGDPLVNSNTGGMSGLRLKSPEAIAGGPSHPGVKRLCELIQQRVPGFKEWTALNDAYHVNKGSKGGHPKGLAADFTLTNGIQGSDKAASMATEILRQANLAPNEFIVINEYRKTTAISTGGHVHVGFRTPAAAQKFLEASGGNQKAGEDTTGGGMVGEQETPNRAQPAVPPVENQAPAPEGPDPAEGTSVPGNGGKQEGGLNSGIPAPEPRRPAPQPQAAPEPRTPSRPEPAPAPAPAMDTSQLLEGLAALLNSTNANGQADRDLLSKMLEQLTQLNKKGASASKAVNVG